MIPWAKFEGRETIYTDWVYNITPYILRHNVDPLSTIKKYAETHMLYNTTERRYSVSQFDNPAAYDFESQHVSELTTCLRNLTTYIEKHEPMYPSPIQKPIDTSKEDNLIGVGSFNNPAPLDGIPPFTLSDTFSLKPSTSRPHIKSPTAIPISSILNTATSTFPTPHPGIAKVQPDHIQISSPRNTMSTSSTDEVVPKVVEYSRAHHLAGPPHKSERCLRAFRRIKMRRSSKAGSQMRGSALLGGKGMETLKRSRRPRAEPVEVGGNVPGEEGELGMRCEDEGEERKLTTDVAACRADNGESGLSAIHTLSEALNGNGKRVWDEREGSEEYSQTRWMKQMKREVVSAREQGFKRQQEAMRDRKYGLGMSMPLATRGEQWQGRGRGPDDQRVMWPQR